MTLTLERALLLPRNDTRTSPSVQGFSLVLAGKIPFPGRSFLPQRPTDFQPVRLEEPTTSVNVQYAVQDLLVSARSFGPGEHAFECSVCETAVSWRQSSMVREAESSPTLEASPEGIASQHRLLLCVDHHHFGCRQVRKSAFAKPPLSCWRTGYFARHQLDDRTMGTCSLVDSEASPRLLRKMPELLLCDSTPKGRRVQPLFARGKSKPPLRSRASLAFLSLTTNATTVARPLRSSGLSTPLLWSTCVRLTVSDRLFLLPYPRWACRTE